MLLILVQLEITDLWPANVTHIGSVGDYRPTAC